MEKSLSIWIVYTIGLLAQGCFSARILAQWIISERQKRVVSPTIFWILSLLGSYLFFIYGVLRDDFAIMFGQIISYYIYIWNLKIKGVFNGESYKEFKKVLKIILLATPVLAVLYIAKDWAAFKANYLSNSAIPSALVIYGSLGQVIFTLRFIYQYFYSKKRGDSRLPAGFWIISLIGSAIIVSYAFIRKDPILALGQSIGFVSYSRNLYLIYKNKEDE